MATPDLDTGLVIETVGEVAVARFTREVVLSGRLAEVVSEKLGALLEPDRVRLLIDFANVKSLSSIILAKLVSLNRKAESLGGRFALCSLRPDVHEIMDVTRLTQILCVYNEEQEALQSF